MHINYIYSYEFNLLTSQVRNAMLENPISIELYKFLRKSFKINLIKNCINYQIKHFLCKFIQKVYKLLVSK